jgi:hypothetical protein
VVKAKRGKWRAAGELGAEVEHGRVGGDEEDVLAGRCGTEEGVDEGGVVAGDGRWGGPACVLEAEGDVLAAVAAGPARGDAAGQQLVVDVPDPAHVLAVGEAVVERRPDLEARPGCVDGGEQAEHLVRAGGVLAEHEAEAAAFEVDDFLAAEGGADICDAGADGVIGEAEDARRGDGGEGEGGCRRR